MPSPLPNTVADYFAASNASDFLRLERCFAENAVVRDEGREHRGPKAIAARRLARPNETAIPL